jgi:hypothetical protein
MQGSQEALRIIHGIQAPLQVHIFSQLLDAWSSSSGTGSPGAWPTRGGEFFFKLVAAREVPIREKTQREVRIRGPKRSSLGMSQQEKARKKKGLPK